MTTTTLTYAQREEVLSQKLHELVSTGWEVQSATATSASVKLPKAQQSIVANMILTIFTAGLWLFVWMLAWLANPRPYDVHAQVSVDAHGVVKTSKMGILGARVKEDRRWAVAAAYEAGEYEPQYPEKPVESTEQSEDRPGKDAAQSTMSKLLFGYRD